MTLPRPVYRVVWAIHRLLWRLSGHRLGTAKPGKGVGTLFLVTTGRTSGQTRRNGLFYVEDGAAFVVVASNAGADVDPQWWRNLQASPDAAVEVGARTIPVRARRAAPDDEARLWPRLVAGNPEFATYRAGMTRELPIIVLEQRV